MKVLGIVVNYRTADRALRATESLVKALEGMDGRVTLVDNDSGDGSYEKLVRTVSERGWSRVARPESSSSRPVANGSSVPAWPVRAPVRRRTSATIANDEGPAGLSTRTIPLGSSALDGTSGRRASRAVPPPRGR